jgi:hypothetical protein
MRLQSAIISAATFINIRLIKPNTGIRYKDSFNVIGKRYNCFIKLLLLRIEKLAYKDIVNRQ